MAQENLTSNAIVDNDDSHWSILFEGTRGKGKRKGNQRETSDFDKQRNSILIQSVF